MKRTTEIGVISVLGLVALVAARALPAAEVIGGGQEQARLLLSGGGRLSDGGTPSGRPKPEFVSPSSSAADPIAADGQAQAREMILGRHIAKPILIHAQGLRVAGAHPHRVSAKDPHEMARQMIVGSP